MPSKLRGVSLSISQSLILIGIIAVAALTTVIWIGYAGISNGRTAAQMADARQVDLRIVTLAELDLANLATVVSRRLNYEVFPAQFKKHARAGLQSLGANVDAIGGKIHGADEQKALAGLRDGLAGVKGVVAKIESDPTVDDEQKFIHAGAAVVAGLDVFRRSFEDQYKTAAKNKEASLDSAVSRPLAIGGITVAVLIAVMLVLGISIRRPLQQMTGAMRELASGNSAIVLPGLGRKDEIGTMAKAVEIFKQNAIERTRLEAETAERANRAAEERRRSMIDLADSFEAAVGNIVKTVSSSASKLESAASALTGTADTTQQLSGSVAVSAEQASTNVQSVASAADELAASVNEISRQVQASSKIAGEAVQQAQQTDARIGELSLAARRIGDVVKLITAIAEQTNLLALNATIEAARAGDAGRGFAVVAHEVKALAAQTAKATDEISTQIASMQSATEGSVAAIKEIGSTIGRISEIASTIATAVEEQGATTQEIARNVQRAAQGTTEVASNIAEVNKAAGETGSSSNQVLASAQALSGEGTRLKMEVDKFLTTVRAA